MTALTYQGKPCAHGHDGTRYASNRKCVACSRREVRYFRMQGGDVYDVCRTQMAAELMGGDGFEIWRAVRVK